MKKHLIILAFLAFAAMANAQKTHVVIKTNMGNMRAVLFDDTPKHRDEFIRLVKAKHFDGTLFYRSVKDFVIQGGSSDSRNARAGRHIGYGDEAVNIDSEFRKELFHKFGALCAPRQPDKVNMLKTSDISQFYIVKGSVYTNEMLDNMEKSVNVPIKKKLRATYYEPYKAELNELKTANPSAYRARMTEIKDKLSFEYSISGYKEFTEEQREAYTTVGGTPFLDDEYTVFGQITEGFDVIRKINALKVDSNDRPLTDVKIEITIVE